jgi:cytochrome b6-f complex iron-sulfur subunit
MHRKEFIKTCGYACLGGAALISLIQSCAGTAYFAQTSFEEKRITIKKTEFRIIGNEKITERKFVLVKSEKFGYPIGVYKIAAEEYSALLLQCTHNGCELQPHANLLVCPCHGSEFSNTGIVQNPPAEQNLASFQTTTDNENIYIHF